LAISASVREGNVDTATRSGDFIAAFRLIVLRALLLA